MEGWAVMLLSNCEFVLEEAPSKNAMIFITVRISIQKFFDITLSSFGSYEIIGSIFF